jgi:aminopeptidase N
MFKGKLFIQIPGKEMIKQILIVVLLTTTMLMAQDEGKSIAKMERERYSHLMKMNEVQYPGDSKIDITYYGLDLTVTYSPNYLTGIITIDVKSDTTVLNSCFLDLRDFMIVDSILINGSSTPFVHSNNKVNITMDHTYTLGEPFTLKVYYKGVPGGSGFGGFYFQTHAGTPIISTLSESYSGPYWWPQKDTPADKADSSDVWITVANNLIPVSNGTLESVVDNGNGTHTYYWKERYSIAAYLISLAITNYTQYNTYYHYGSIDSMIITHFIYPEDFSSVKSYLDETDDMITVFANRYGEYPFIEEKYGHAEFEWSGAMEHQTCTSIGSFSSGIISHELAHQWYGDMITCKDWRHIWLNEGFATYSEAVYIEAKNGRAAYDSKIVNEMSLAKQANGTIWVENVLDENEIFNYYRSYKKAGCVLHMLRGIVGDSTFFDIMRTYSDAPNLKYNAATTEDFQAVAESVYGQTLNYFFQEWIYGENEPTYSVGWNSSLVGGDIYNMNINVNQVTNSNPTFFTMPVQIKIHTSLGDTTVTLFNDTQYQNFQFEVVGQPLSIVFDPGNWILKNTTTVTEVNDFYQPLNFSLEQNYPNPFNPSTTISYTIPESGLVTLKVYDVLGREVATLVNEQNEAGIHQVDFNASNLNSGVYFYTIESSNPSASSGQSFVETKKMILIK